MKEQLIISNETKHKVNLKVTLFAILIQVLSFSVIFIFFCSYSFGTQPDTSYKESPLHEATYKGNIEKVKELVKQGGIDINAIGRNSGNTPLHWAINVGKVTLVSFNLRTGIPPHFLKPPDKKKYLKIIGFLIEKGADVNIKNIKGDTPLHIAIKNQNTEIIELLIRKRAKLNVKNNKGKTPLHLARQSEIVKLLIEKGADVNAKDREGKTPLFMRSGLNTNKFLIEKGADVNIRDNKGMTPLHYAIQRKLWKISKLLIEKGTNVNIKDNEGIAPLHKVFSLTYDIKETAKLLIESGADVNAKDNKGIAPFHKVFSLTYDIKETAKLLIESGADVNIKDNKGQSPLHTFSTDITSSGKQKEFREVAEFLIKNGANVNAKDNEGKTPLDYVDDDDKEKIKFLRANGGRATSFSKNLKAFFLQFVFW